jgi:1-acyl-sn-glycerol-3-phosphate acyltransferase
MSVFYRSLWWIVHGICRAYFRVRIVGLEHVPLDGPLILASNHVSFIDPPLIGSMVPRVVNFLARDSLFRVPLLGGLMRQLKTVPVDRDSGGAGLKAILDRLQGGGAIILFPEGTRSPNGQLLPAKAGVGLTVIKTTAPLVPVRLDGAFEAWGRHRRFPLPRKITITFGPPLKFERERTEAASCDRSRLKTIYQEVANRIMVEIAGLPR